MKWLRAREHAAFAKGLMFGKTIGRIDERKRILALLEAWNRGDEDDTATMMDAIREGK